MRLLIIMAIVLIILITIVFLIATVAVKIEGIDDVITKLKIIFRPQTEIDSEVKEQLSEADYEHGNRNQAETLRTNEAGQQHANAKLQNHSGQIAEIVPRSCPGTALG